MPQRKGAHNCGVCRHPQRAEIEAALAEGVSYPKIAGQFWVKPDRVRHHVERTAKLRASVEAEGPGDTTQQQPEAKR